MNVSWDGDIIVRVYLDEEMYTNFEDKC